MVNPGLMSTPPLGIHLHELERFLYHTLSQQHPTHATLIGIRKTRRCKLAGRTLHKARRLLFTSCLGVLLSLTALESRLPSSVFPFWVLLR